MPNIIYKVLSGSYNKIYNHYVFQDVHHDDCLLKDEKNSNNCDLQDEKSASEILLMFYLL